MLNYYIQLSSAGDVGDYKAALEQSVSFALQKLKFDSCQTSLAACRLLKLVHEVPEYVLKASVTVQFCFFFLLSIILYFFYVLLYYVCTYTLMCNYLRLFQEKRTTQRACILFYLIFFYKIFLKKYFPHTHHQVMKQASSSSASAPVAHSLFQSARDCLELFMAIVPMQFAEIIDTPRMGAVFYNDCLYIAHNCTLLTHKYRHEMGKIDEVLLHTVGFMDFIPRFRQLGDAVLAKHLEAQRVALVGLVHSIHISPDCDSSSSNSTSVVGRYTNLSFCFYILM